MACSPLTRALILLLIFSLLTTSLAALSGLFFGESLSGPLAALAALGLAMLKGRVILSDYLGLRQAPGIRRGFNALLVGFTLLAAALYLLPFVL